jgi:predicted transcriptional regulator
MEAEDRDDLVIYTVDGRPLTRKELEKEIAAAEEDYKNGNFITQEELKEEIKNWRK